MYDFSQITEVKLASGSHGTPEQGLCFMEMVSWFAGERHSDKPACACPVLGAYGIALNDAMPADVRDRLLKPLVPMIAGTRGTMADQRRRAEFFAMWSINRMLPVALRAINLDDLALECEQVGDLKSAMPILQRARAAAAAAEAAAAAAAGWRAAAAGWRAAAEAAAAAAAGWRAAAAAAEAEAAGWRAAAEAAAAAAAEAAGWRAAAALPVWELAVEGLRQAILIGPHEGFDAAVDFAKRHDDLRALIAA